MYGKMFCGFVIIFLVLSLAGHGSTQMYSLFEDDRMCSCDFFPTAPYQTFTVYVYLESPEEGASAAEYMMTTLPNCALMEQQIAPFVAGSVTGKWLGSPGISAPFTSCQTGIIIIAWFTFIGMDMTPGYFTIKEHEDSGFLGIATCESGNPPMDASVRFNFGYNEGCSA
jgi:hypothetical protein